MDKGIGLVVIGAFFIAIGAAIPPQYIWVVGGLWGLCCNFIVKWIKEDN